MIAIEAARDSTTSIWWVEKISVRPRAASSRKAARRRATLTGSRPVNGSSIRTTSRVVQDGRDELDLLLVALAQLVGPPVGEVRDPEALEPVERVAAGLGLRDAVQAGEEDELVEHPHPGVQAALLGR